MGTRDTGTRTGGFFSGRESRVSDPVMRIIDFVRQKKEQPGINREEDERLRRLRLLQGGAPFETQTTTQTSGRKMLLGQ